MVGIDFRPDFRGSRVVRVPHRHRFADRAVGPHVVAAFCVALAGFAVVGRLALPNTLPASHHFEINAATGTDVDFGTVAPAFGQAGGGVEAFFSKGAKNASGPPAVHPDLPDE